MCVGKKGEGAVQEGTEQGRRGAGMAQGNAGSFPCGGWRAATNFLWASESSSVMRGLTFYLIL